MTEKRTSGLRVKSIDFNNESNIFVDKSVEVTVARLESQEILINQSHDVRQFMEETDKMKKTIHKIKEIWESENTPKNARENKPSDLHDNIYTKSDEGKCEERELEI